MNTAVQVIKWINELLHTPVSPKSVRRLLQSEGLRAASKVKKPLFRAKHRNQTRLCKKVSKLDCK